MRRVFWVFLFTTGFLFLMASSSWGVGVLGATNLMITPTASTLNPNTMGVAVNLLEGDLSFFNFDYGLTRDLEAGAAIYHYPGYTDISLRIKYQLLGETRSGFGLAIGVEDLGQDEVSPYLTLSKYLADVGVRGYLGFGGGGFDGPFAGLSKNFGVNGGGSLKQIQLFVEADSMNFNMGAKLMVGSQTKINFGLLDMDRWVVGVTFLAK